MLIPICPASTSRSKRRAAAPSRVKMAVPLPSVAVHDQWHAQGVKSERAHRLRLMSSMASSRVSTFNTVRHGPKISFLGAQSQLSERL